MANRKINRNIKLYNDNTKYYFLERDKFEC